MCNFEAAPTKDAVPVFWTVQYMKRLEYVGHASGKDDIIVRGDLEGGKFIAYYLKDGAVATASGMQHDKDMASIIALMSAPKQWRLNDLHPEKESPTRVLEKMQKA